MLPKRIKRPKMGVRERPQIRSPGHLSFVRSHQCCVSNEDCIGQPIEAAHCRGGTDGALGVKPSDSFTVPLCRAHHQEQHQRGEDTFQSKYKIDMKAIAADLWRRSPHRRKHEQ